VTWVLLGAVGLLNVLALIHLHVTIMTLKISMRSLEIRVLATSSPEYHDLQQKIAGSIEEMHGVVLKARATGDLDLANRMMELQHWADCDYEARWLDGMFRGFP
jgi:hypothetical protein